MFLVFGEVSVFLFPCMTFSDNRTISVYSIFPSTSLIFSEVGSNNWWRFGNKFTDFDLMLVTLCLYFLNSIRLLFSGKSGVWSKDTIVLDLPMESKSCLKSSISAVIWELYSNCEVHPKVVCYPLPSHWEHLF